jgi:hypothetical protein
LRSPKSSELTSPGSLPIRVNISCFTALFKRFLPPRTRRNGWNDGHRPDQADRLKAPPCALRHPLHYVMTGKESAVASPMVLGPCNHRQTP